MPSFMRKLVIYATADGLVLQSNGSWDQPSALRIEYRSHKLVSSPPSPAEVYRRNPYLEAHGIIGLLSVSSLSYLISVTRREQVAQIFGKSVYVVADVALLPLSSQRDTEKAITEALSALRKSDQSVKSDGESSDSEPSASESDEEKILEEAPEVSSPAEDARPGVERSSSSTNIAEEVFTRRGPYGRFASQWFSKRGWALSQPISSENGGHPPLVSTPKDVEDGLRSTEEQPKEHATLTTVSTSAAGSCGPSQGETVNPDSTSESIHGLLPKLLRSTKLILSSRSFFFSYDLDLTRRLGESSLPHLKPPMMEKIDPLFFWNRNLGSSFLNGGHGAFLLPIMQGFVGQRAFAVKRNSENHPNAEAFETLEGSVAAADETGLTQSQPRRQPGHQQSFLLTLVSRRSTKRSGLRYLRRGIDDSGNVANTVESEQILSTPFWESSSKASSFVQIRGSIPLYFSQTPYSFKPVPVLHQSTSTNQAAFGQHFESLGGRYGSVQIVVLLDKHGGELKIGEEYQEATKRFNEGGVAPRLSFQWFDFHSECRGMKFENVDRLVKALESTLNSFGMTVVQNKTTKQVQTGVIRTNCMDCLDRTNVVQSAFAQYMLQKELEQAGFEIDLLHDVKTHWFNTLWADNGDAISREYASTSALKGDFTRTRKRNYRGAINDLGLTLSRYYNNMVNDYFSQAVIDLLLGNVSGKVFEDFETSMMSVDPGISIGKIRESAIEICRGIVIQDPQEDLVHAWATLSPAQPDTLRTLPFEESVLLLTDAALYSCKFDWNNEKVTSFERVDLRAITKIHYGIYISSTLTARQMDEKLNIGIAVLYTPGKESIVRVNTRSLQNSREVDSKAIQSGGDSTMSMTSWLGSKPSETSRTVAFKVIPSNSGDSALTYAKRICEDIQRVIREGGTDHGEDGGASLAEKMDIISLAEARKRTGYLEQLGHSIRKLVWA